MAELFGLKERQLALTEIRAKLKELEPINSFLQAENTDGYYRISFGQYKTTLYCPDRETINALVLAHKKQLVGEIRSLAEKNGVVFDEKEEASLK